MAYPNNYFNSYYQPQYSQMQQAVQQPQQNNSNFVWVQGESAAKSYPVVSGQSMLLMDSEDSVFYIKSTDQSGMPQPLRIFDYKERKDEHTTQTNAVTTPNVDYVSRSEFDAFKSEIQASLRQRQQNNNPNVKRNNKEE